MQVSTWKIELNYKNQTTIIILLSHLKTHSQQKEHKYKRLNLLVAQDLLYTIDLIIFINFILHTLTGI